MVPGGTGLSQLRRGALEYCVLSMLRERAQYGFELVKALSELDGLVTTEGTIYPLLARLRKEKLVRTFWQESEAGPPRRYYELTKQGTKALDEFSDQWTRFRDTVDSVLGTETR